MRSAPWIFAFITIFGCTSERDLGDLSTPPPPTRDGGTNAGPTCDRNQPCATGVCDVARATCVECRFDADCVTGSRCEASACVDATTCSGDLDCTAEGRVCDVSRGTCAECNSAADCSDRPCVGGSCSDTVACQTTQECAADALVCATALPPRFPASFMGMACLECGQNGDCAPGFACVDSACFDVCTSAERVCGPFEGTDCGSCSGDSTCATSGRACIERISVASGSSADAEGPIAVFGGNKGVITLDLRVGGMPQWVHDVQSNQALGTVVDGVVYVVDGDTVYSGPPDATLTMQRQLPNQADGGGPVSGGVECTAIVRYGAGFVCALEDLQGIVPPGLYQIPANGDPARLLVADATGVRRMFLTGDRIVYEGNRRVFVADLIGGTRSELDTRQNDAQLFGVAHGAAYATSLERTEFYVAPLDGSPPTVTDRTLAPQSAVVVTERAVIYDDERVFVELDATLGNERELFQHTELELDTTNLSGVHELDGDAYLFTWAGVIRVRR